MPSEDISNYFDTTEFAPTRDDLVFAAGLVETPKVAIDCGCGAGADIDYLVKNGFKVFGFDIEEESINRCKARFGSADAVSLSRCSFVEFEYPRASLVVADASLFYCPRSDFDKVWQKISDCLCSGGIFCGSFLGPEDTMARGGDNSSVFWSEVCVFDEDQVRKLFENFKVIRFNEYKSTGETAQGDLHDWHIFQVVAEKTQ